MSMELESPLLRGGEFAAHPHATPPSRITHSYRINQPPNPITSHAAVNAYNSSGVTSTGGGGSYPRNRVASARNRGESSVTKHLSEPSDAPPDNKFAACNRRATSSAQHS